MAAGAFGEMIASRAMYKDGWWAASKPDRIPWDFSLESIGKFGPDSDWDADKDAPYSVSPASVYAIHVHHNNGLRGRTVSSPIRSTLGSPSRTSTRPRFEPGFNLRKPFW
jgi:hypothetical protein